MRIDATDAQGSAYRSAIARASSSTAATTSDGTVAIELSNESVFCRDAWTFVYLPASDYLCDADRVAAAKAAAIVKGSESRPDGGQRRLRSEGDVRP